MKPFLKWAGGKRQLLPELYVVMRDFDSKGHYYEPFVGGGALFFDMRATGWSGAATLGDSNKRLIRTYLGVRNDVEQVITSLKACKYEKKFFLRERARRIDDTHDDAEVAAWFIYLNKAGFNGLYRVNRKNEFNVPFGRYTNPTICDEDNLRAASRALQKTKIVDWDFERCVKSAETGDLIYFDPPYTPVSATADFTAYTAVGFGDADHVRLRDCALALKRQGVHVILSNADCPAVRQMYKAAYGFKVRAVEARRAINSDSTKRGKVGEVIIT